ncbi:solute carrier family 2, facilitated glucose transporter member 1-like isoform X3 [Varroa jacobsoni]|uniref:Major facilitator superfamily (MFS) profile domain-containing protein n=2 Tax=Varroa destructor TaxID=109461 RepID=A0A7M7KQF1_VARDE|nr:solute carrier family 2, facilitated glucose transporter member 1-like isoform X3 [Varroa destructor]XP_022691844.1 solute carrier family 2, facilitated glucose transporter member 1-like isoform X3 [Varroa jacobsoni]
MPLRYSCMSKLAHQEAPKTVSLVDYHVEDEPTKFKEVAKQQKVAYRCCGLTKNLAFAIGAAALGSAFQHGYNTGVVNAPQKHVEAFINDTYKHRFEEYPTESTIKMIYSIIVSIYCIGGMMGGLLTAFVSEKFGRKGGLLLNNIFVLIAAALMGFSKRCRSYEMIIMGRFFIGVNNGLNAGLAPLYLNEISPTQMRGAVGTIYQLTVTIAILVSNILGLGNLLGTDELWPVLFSFTIVPSILMLLTFPLCPESPKYILINQGKDVAAQQALTWLRGSLEVHDEMDEMRVEFEQIKMVPRVTLYEMVHNIGLRTPLIISMMMMLSQQLSGINAAIFFSTNIFLDAGLSNSEATRATIGVGVINTLMTLVSLVLVERAGRRTLHLIGLAGMACLTVVLTLCLALKDEIKELSYLSVGAVVGFVIMFATGPGSIPWFMVGELFGQGARPLATSLSVAVNWTANFVVGMTFLPLTGILGHYTFLIFTGFLIFFWIFTYRRVPETKGKSVEEIAAIFRQRAYQ